MIGSVDLKFPGQSGARVSEGVANIKRSSGKTISRSEIDTIVADTMGSRAGRGGSSQANPPTHLNLRLG